MIKECKKHGLSEHFKRTDSNSYRCLICSKEHSKKQTRIRRNKQIQKTSDLIEYKGGKCQNCGYTICNEALEFHHIKPTQKEFNISHYLNFSIEKLKAEADKCILVCGNCHREIHDNILKFTIEEEKITFEYIEEN